MLDDLEIESMKPKSVNKKISATETKSSQLSTSEKYPQQMLRIRELLKRKENGFDFSVLDR